eukprot:TRINITY_DN66078_c3_g6_i2.p1 TRINITY_DN66078_c3_g6~~TRINITY_DN66078_c3_g6_i2.p1  ORF type:complete len:515 (+),score=251.11 TRINITY_DN66078_c3_g6_i2:85-1629(+)
MQLTVAPNGQSAMPAMPAMPAESAVSAVPRPAAVAAEKKAQQQQAKPLRRYQSVVSCGSVSGCRSRKWAVFGDESVDVYHAAEDPHRRDLVKSSCLADFFRCSKSRVAMFLSRNKVKMDGIYQATKISNNEHWQTIGVRVGGYFVTQVVCEAFRRHIGHPLSPNGQSASGKSRSGGKTGVRRRRTSAKKRKAQRAFDDRSTTKRQTSVAAWNDDMGDLSTLSGHTDNSMSKKHINVSRAKRRRLNNAHRTPSASATTAGDVSCDLDNSAPSLLLSLAMAASADSANASEQQKPKQQQQQKAKRKPKQQQQNPQQQQATKKSNKQFDFAAVDPLMSLMMPSSPQNLDFIKVLQTYQTMQIIRSALAGDSGNVSPLGRSQLDAPLSPSSLPGSSTSSVADDNASTTSQDLSPTLRPQSLAPQGLMVSAPVTVEAAADATTPRSAYSSSSSSSAPSADSTSTLSASLPATSLADLQRQQQQLLRIMRQQEQTRRLIKLQQQQLLANQAAMAARTTSN